MSLAGRRIVNTRAAHQAAALDTLLRTEGATPLPYPAIAIVPPEDTGALDAALMGKYDLLVLTSTNTVESVAERLRALGISLKGMPTAVIGAATAGAAREQLGVEITVMPDEQNSEALADALLSTAGMRILLPQSALARPTLAEKLRTRGAEVTAVTAYRTVKGRGGVEIALLLRDGLVDAVTFTSGSGVRYFSERLHDEGGDSEKVRAACLSGQISRAAKEQGFMMVAEAHSQTLEGLVAALSKYFGGW